MSSLTAVLGQELETLQRFCSLLSDEQSALTGARAEALPVLAEQKAALAATLSRLEHQRDALLKVEGKEPGRDGMEQWLTSPPANSVVREQWTKLLALAAEAQARNETNGRLINLLLKHNQEALDSLLSGSGTGGSIYGPDGQHRNMAGKRHYGAA